MPMRYICHVMKYFYLSFPWIPETFKMNLYFNRWTTFKSVFELLVLICIGMSAQERIMVFSIVRTSEYFSNIRHGVDESNKLQEFHLILILKMDLDAI